jgi:perosamine synthetase
VHLIEFSNPRIGEHDVEFAWSVTPKTELYERSAFHLRFPESVDIGRVPMALWWRIALLSLHAHWTLLRPCRVVLPVRLPAGEVEFWLRLTDAAVRTLEAHAGRDDTRRSIELIGGGAEATLERPPVQPAPGTVACFSGGRDSTTQAAMLCELGEEPILVSVTSPVDWSVEHETPRRRQVFEEIGHRLPVEHVEVHSDLRTNYRNYFALEHYGRGVNELTDGLLYLGAALAVASARGLSRVMMASEAEVQENVKRGGSVIQHPHFMYSAVTHRALAALVEPLGLRIGSLTNSLHQFQAQRLLAERYVTLRELQYSCYKLRSEQRACSRCAACRKIALTLMTSGVSPSEIGIDVAELMDAFADWKPGSRYVSADSDPDDWRPDRAAGRGMAMQELRCLQQLAPDRIAAEIDGSRAPGERERAVRIFTALRDRALSYEVEPEPGFREGYLELVDPELRPGLRSILAAHFAPAAPATYARTLANTRLLSDWIARPLRSREPTPSLPDWTAPLGDLIPGPEPELRPGPEGRIVRVAGTSLDGNELEYVSACVRENWVSSAGAYVKRFEREFAAAVGCRYGVACSSGTAALHLALAAAGVGPADEVLVPAFTMIATANATLYTGAQPVLVDADPCTWNLDPERMADKLTSRTRAVTVVHTYGQPVDMEAIRSFAARNDLLVIEDAAEAHGARYEDAPIGSVGDVAAFSFYGNKIITTGEGGIVTTNDRGIADAARELRDHAFSTDRHFWHRRVGFNYRMTNLQAAIGLAQTERFDELVERRRRTAERYRAKLAGIAGLELPPSLDGGVTWMFGIKLAEDFGISRDDLRRALAARGIETRTFFVPLHLQPVLHERFAGQRYPVAEELGRTGLYLPSGPTLAAEDIDYVAEAIRAAQVLTPSSA